MSLYLLVERFFVVGKAAYGLADQAVAKYAKNKGISKADAWKLLMKEADKRTGEPAKKIRKYAKKRISK